MNGNKIFLSLLLLTFFGCTHVQSQGAKSDMSPIVIELFTSEGCSSCPPADDLIAKIKKEYANQPVYILAYHVDYWDRLGWKDTFSDAIYSKRQYKYASWIKTSSVYTPQIIVNGTAQFVGSNTARLRSELVKTSGLQENTISLKTHKKESGELEVNFNLKVIDKQNTLNVALVEDEATVQVKRGENSNRNLHHVNIVRALKNVDAVNSGSVSFTLQKDLTENYHIIAFLQNSKTGKIIAATGN